MKQKQGCTEKIFGFLTRMLKDKDYVGIGLYGTGIICPLQIYGSPSRLNMFYGLFHD